MKTDDVIIKKSDIHGRGVFAARNFKRGEIVLQWDTTHVISEKEFNEMTHDDQRYVTFLDNTYVVMQEPERYVNHSCDANTLAQQHCDIAKRTIQRDEEITADYREELPPDAHMKCNCKSKNCVKTIKAPRKNT